MRILCIGECMVELAPLADAGTFRLGYAGDTFNTAWYLRRCAPAGWQVDYLTAVGQDAVSDRMVACFATAGIGTAHVLRLPGRTVGLYLIELVAGERSFSYWRGQSAARCLADDPGHLARALAGADLAYLSGITLAILSDDARARLTVALDAFRRAGGRVAFDPNLRPRLWPSTQSMREAVMQAASACDIALPSHDDEAAHFGDADPMATLRRYAGAGAIEVVVKNGAGGMPAQLEGQVWHFTPPSVAEVVDTTAAGDSFNAAFLAARLGGSPPLEALARGAGLAGRVIGARGALVAV
ncbi:MAG TPA: sugar kinase [Paracoccaceae bacterium]|nr:sugar kinase [Paracoccaceae bacterium]HMO70339.1 sugar kinase [Paracoccaceae bacterium]